MPKKKLKSPTKGGPIGNGRPIVPPAGKAKAKKPAKPKKKLKSPAKGGPGGGGRGGINPP